MVGHGTQFNIVKLSYYIFSGYEWMYPLCAKTSDEILLSSDFHNFSAPFNFETSLDIWIS